jgi:hypothetical protein
MPKQWLYGILICCMCGCSRHNPLQDYSAKDAATILQQAAISVNGKYNLFNTSGGRAYLLCMQHKLDSKTCYKYYNYILKLLRHRVSLSNLQIQDLRDPNYFKQIVGIYTNIVFNYIEQP